MSEPALVDIFKQEAEEILKELETDIVKLEEENDPEIVNRVFRYVHTLKGSSGIAGLTEISDFTHKVEGLLDRVRDGKLEIGKRLIDILLGSIDWIRLSMFEDQQGLDMDVMRGNILNSISEYDVDVHGTLKRVDSADDSTLVGEVVREGGGNDILEKDVGYRYFMIKACFKEDIFEYGIDPLMIMEDLSSQGRICEGRINRKKLPDFKDMDPEKCYLHWDVVLKTKHSRDRIQNVFLFVEDDNEIYIDDVTSIYVDKGRNDKDLEAKRIGEILVDKGIVTNRELDNILTIQDKKNLKIGDIVVQKGYATEKDIKFGLEEQERAKARIDISTVRVETKKLDSLLDLLGEIVIGQASIARIADGFDDEQGFILKNALYGLDRTTREFQEQIMSIRMIPIGPTFEQFRRFVRDSAQSNGKDIRLEIEGRDTELDKTVIEKIGDPLKHMIRNSIDHGIEMPKERVECGKSRSGKIILKAYHQEGNVYIEIADDGKGIDKERVREKAEMKGIIKRGEDVSDERILSCLFMPGFSTAERVGELSGRGVGMDVVKTNIEELRGTVEIETEKGMGTIFRIKLPLTLAIIEGMLVRVGRSIYIIPLLSIVESLQPSREAVETVEGKGEVIYVRGEYVMLLRLYDLFGIEPEYRNPWESLVVIVESGGVLLGLMIDDLIGQQQIVIKSLDNYITKSRAVSGASILGDGTVSLILDIHGLIGEIAR
ncbi:MAG: chemotaxis protein CheA [Spirochaetota bacterium]|nr:chemotaxis protein CheA [Spirochaetota bacterium]